jgi:hypothetical protein
MKYELRHIPGLCYYGACVGALVVLTPVVLVLKRLIREEKSDEANERDE